MRILVLPPWSAAGYILEVLEVLEVRAKVLGSDLLLAAHLDDLGKCLGSLRVSVSPPEDWG